MYHRFRFTAWLMVACLAATPLAAQDSPEAAAMQFGKAMAAGDWPSAARVMHPAALRQLRDLFSLALNNDKLGQAREQLFGMKSVAEASAAPDTALFAAFLKNVLTRQPGFLQAMKTARIDTVGHVSQAGDTAFVLLRVTFTSAGATLTQMDVMPVIREGKTWRAGLKTDFINMAAMLKSVVAPVGG